MAVLNKSSELSESGFFLQKSIFVTYVDLMRSDERDRKDISIFS